jgi:hypothetical protein
MATAPQQHTELTLSRIPPQSEGVGSMSVGAPLELVRLAIAQNADLEKLTKLMDLYERTERHEARKAFVEAMSAFKAHAIQVVKDKVNPQYGSRYVSLGRLVETVTPFLSKHGLSVRWEIDQASGIKVSCVITHVAGHSESVAMVCPPDKSGAKNPIQEIKSAITYAKACTFESICGLASSDASVDDDGNGGTSTGISAERIDEVCQRMNAAPTVDACWNLFKDAYKEAREANDRSAMKTYLDLMNARKAARQ